MNLSDAYDLIFAQEAERTGVPFTWLKAIAGAESDYIPDAYRAEPAINDASRGLMQLLYRTAYGLGFRGQPDELFDPQLNVQLGADLVKENISRFGFDFDRVYSAYNSGSPTAYKTNAEVAAHLDRARRYLAAVEASVTTVTPGPDTDTSSLGTVLAIAAFLGIAVYYFGGRS